MKSIREIYNIGYGPSSSHTMGPSRAAGLFLEKNPGAEKFRVTLYGSLALTGKGHGTDSAILKVIDRCCRDRLETGYQSAPPSQWDVVRGFCTREYG